MNLGQSPPQQFDEHSCFYRTLAATKLLEHALALADKQRARAEADLLDELRIPSISALSEHRADVRSNAEWLSALLTRIGFVTWVINMPGELHPILRADLMVDVNKPTLTIYGHYDVQPVDPLDEWETEPFKPTVREAMVYARGAADSKANHIAAIKAAEYTQLGGGSPLNLRFLIEGEEEIVGNALGRYASENPRELATDYLVVLDGSFDFDDTPTLVTGLRGVLHVQLDATGPATDLHSGVYGGVAPNPLNTLARVLAALNAYWMKEQVPNNLADLTIPLGVPEVLREGADLTVVTYGAMCRLVMDAAQSLSSVGIELEVIDVQTLSPFDVNHSIARSIEKTGAVLFADEDVPGGASAFMMREVLEAQGAYEYLDAPPRTLSSAESRPAYGIDGDYFSKPNPDEIVRTAYAMIRERRPDTLPSLIAEPDS